MATELKIEFPTKPRTHTQTKKHTTLNHQHCITNKPNLRALFGIGFGTSCDEFRTSSFSISREYISEFTIVQDECKFSTIIEYFICIIQSNDDSVRRNVVYGTVNSFGFRKLN